MPKDAIKEGMTFALGIVKISGENFNKIMKGLEKKNKLSANEGKKMVYNWVTVQQKQLVKMQAKMRAMKKQALKTRLYSSKDLAEVNKVIKNLSLQIAGLEKKKKNAETTLKKQKKTALKKRTAKKKTAKKKTVKKKKAKKRTAKKKK